MGVVEAALVEEFELLLAERAVHALLEGSLALGQDFLLEALVGHLVGIWSACGRKS